MYIGLTIEQAEMIENLIYEKFQSGDLKKEEFSKHAILYTTIHKEIEEEEEKEKDKKEERKLSFAEMLGDIEEETTEE